MYGDPFSEIPIDKRVPQQRGQHRQIYKLIHVEGKPILEHRWIMEQYLGRKLFKGENIHHKNGITKDNRIQNLEVWETSQPPGQRIADKAIFYIEWLNKYWNELPDEIRNQFKGRRID